MKRGRKGRRKGRGQERAREEESQEAREGVGPSSPSKIVSFLLITLNNIKFVLPLL